MTVDPLGAKPAAADQSETTLRRGVSILFALGADEAVGGNGLGVTRIAELVGREKSQVSRTLKTLVDCGALDRDPQTLHYRLSWGLYALAARAGDGRLLELATPLLEQLVARLGETAHLSVLRGADVLTVLSQASSSVVAAGGWVGGTTPAYCTSAGRVLLLDRTADELRRLFADVAFERLAPHTPRTVAQVLVRIEEARRADYAVVDEEHESGLIAIAAPVRDARGRVVAAVNVSAPRFRLADHLEPARREVVAAARTLSDRLGAVPEAGRPCA